MSTANPGTRSTRDRGKGMAVAVSLEYLARKQARGIAGDIQKTRSEASTEHNNPPKNRNDEQSETSDEGGNDRGDDFPGRNGKQKGVTGAVPLEYSEETCAEGTPIKPKGVLGMRRRSP